MPQTTETSAIRQTLVQQKFEVFAKALLDEVPNCPQLKEAFKALELAYVWAQRASQEPRSVVDLDVLGRSFKAIEERDQRVIRVWMNSIDYADVLKYSRHELDIESKMVNLRKGLHARWGSTEIWLRRSIPQGFVYPVEELELRTDDGVVVDSHDNTEVYPDLKPDWVPDTAGLVRL